MARNMVEHIINNVEPYEVSATSHRTSHNLTSNLLLNIVNIFNFSSILQ